ncbi:MAG TPA: MBL fold metallo-hydrolase [Chloroflexi bacterium]|nr:MBL fold metallo-hydrolase [Chloroflexota bacterium]
MMRIERMPEGGRQGSDPSEFRITCLVDNTAQLSSRFWAEHGLSFLVEARNAKVLFDTGQSGAVLAHNLALLGEDLQDLSAIVLSHGHYDHTGGLAEALSLAKGVEVIAHPDVFRERFSRRDGELKSIGLPFPRPEIEARARLRLEREAIEVVPGVMTTGQIPRGFGPETREPRHVVREEGKLVPDPFYDDQALVLRTERGLVVVLGCCHAGLINTLERVRSIFGGKIHAILGGTHLARADDACLTQAIAAVKDEYEVEQLYLGHCTGMRGFLAFAQALGERVKPCPAGLRLEF